MKVLKNLQKNCKTIPKAGSQLHKQSDTVIYMFGGLRLNPCERTLLRGCIALTLPAKTFDMLLILIRNQGRLVTKARFLDELWPDTFVDQANLSTHMAKLRKVLGEGAKTKRFIETVHKHGYRFVAEVSSIKDTDPDFAVTGEPNGAIRVHLSSSHGVAAAEGLLVSSGPEQVRDRGFNGTIIDDSSNTERLRVVVREALPDSDVVVLVCRRVV